MFRRLDVVQQANAKNAIHRVGVQVDGEGRRLKSVDSCHHIKRLGGASRGEHVGGIVGGEDDPIGLLAQHRPKTSSAAGQVQHPTGFSSQFQGVTRQLDVTPVRQASCQAVLMFFQVLLGVFPIIFAGKVEFDGGVLGHGETSEKRNARHTGETGIRSPSKGSETFVNERILRWRLRL